MSQETLAPQIYKLLADVQSAQVADERAASLEALESEIKQRTDRNAARGEGATDKSDWTQSYKTWREWAEIEELKAKAEETKSKAQVLKQRQQALGGCNHDHSAERRVFEMPFDQKIKESYEFREQGNAWFLEGQYFRASEYYRKVIIWLDYAFPKTEEEQAQMTKIQLPALLNLTICLLKMKQYNEVLTQCYQVLQLDANNTKALYCQAKAHRFLDNFDEATESILRARAIDPGNVDLRCEQALLENKKRRYRDETKRRAQAMFGQASNSAQPQVRAQHPLLPRRIDILHPQPQRNVFEDEDEDEELGLATAEVSDEDEGERQAEDEDEE